MEQKLMFVSDIHGSRYYCEKALARYRAERADKLILLGDLLYHGARNDLPRDYDTRGTAALLNAVKSEILCVRGNCDSEVDQMVLEFPVRAEALLLYLKGRLVFVTHGHLYNGDSPPMLKKGDILLHGHTHVQAAEEREDYTYINPGSVSIPKGGNVQSYMTYEEGRFIVKDLEGGEILAYAL